MQSLFEQLKIEKVYELLFPEKRKDWLSFGYMSG